MFTHNDNAVNPQVIISRLKQCFERALTNYKQNYTPSWTDTFRGTTDEGQQKATTLINSIGRCQELNSLKLILVTFMKGRWTAVTKNSFFSYFLNELKNEPTLVAQLNEVWFNKRYFPELFYAKKIKLQTASGRAELTLESNVDYTGQTQKAVSHRTIATQLFTSVLDQNENDPGLIEFKDAVYEAFYNYKHTLKLYPSFKEQDSHGQNGIIRATNLKENILKSTRFSDALNAIIQFFTEPSTVFRVVWAGPRDKPHSFISYLLNALHHNEPALEAINSLWFINNPLILENIDYRDNIDSINDARNKLFNSFLMLSEQQQQKLTL